MRASQFKKLSPACDEEVEKLKGLKMLLQMPGKGTVGPHGLT